MILDQVGDNALDAESGPLLRIASGKDRRIGDEMFPGSKHARETSQCCSGSKERMRYLDSSISPAEAKTRRTSSHGMLVVGGWANSLLNIEGGWTVGLKTLQ